MNCDKPFTLNGKAFGCGQCLPCRIKTRRVWTHRIMLEAMEHGSNNTFATLTYSDENIPTDLSVSPREVSLFIKRLRKKTPEKIRYFACGEYGDLTFRPHYHLAIFGLPNCRRGTTRYTRNSQPCCDICTHIEHAWGLGRIGLGELTVQSAAYIAAYTTKKMTRHDDERLEGRLPEFARMSRRPGIGVGMMYEVASTIMQHSLEDKMVDVPLSLAHGTKQLPIGRFLRRKLRTMIGKDEKAPEAAIALQALQLQPLLKNSRNYKIYPKGVDRSWALKDQLLQSTEGNRINIKAKHKLFKKRGSL